MKILEPKKGTITINRDLLDNLSLESLKLLYSNFFPVAITNDRLYISGEMEFHGYSEHFDPVGAGSIPPYYEVTFYSEEGKPMEIQFKRKE